MDLAHFWIYSCFLLRSNCMQSAVSLQVLFFLLHFSHFSLGLRNIYQSVHPMCILTFVFMKPTDGFSSFLDIFLLIHRSNYAKGCFVLFLCFSVYASMRVFIKRADGLCSLSDKFLLIHHISFNKYYWRCACVAVRRSFDLVYQVLRLLYIFLLIHRSNCMQSHVSLQS